MFFSMAELQCVVDSKCVHGVRVWLEHGDATKEDIGTVVHTSLDAETGMHVVMAFDRSNLRSRVVCEWIRNGLFSGISLGYNAELDVRMDVRYKRITEVSIVHKPHHPTCWVYEVCDTLPPALHAAIFGTAIKTPLPPPLSLPMGMLEVACAAASVHGAALDIRENARGTGNDARASWALVFATVVYNLQDK